MTSVHGVNSSRPGQKDEPTRRGSRAVVEGLRRSWRTIAGWRRVVTHGADARHGGPPLTKWALSAEASHVADLGFVVFSATWGAGAPIPETCEQTLPVTSQAACAVAFAQASAAEYGGDPATMIVFGHSFGANTAAMVAFVRPEPSVGCIGSPTLGAIDSLVTWEGDWLPQPTDPDWDARLASDPTFLDGFSPLKHLAEHRDLRVVMLASEHPYADVNPDRPLPDAKAADAFFAQRDPSGDLRRQLEANGALADDNLDLGEAQELLISVLEAQGNPVSLDVVPGSTHVSLSDAGWKVFLPPSRRRRHATDASDRQRLSAGVGLAALRTQPAHRPGTAATVFPCRAGEAHSHRPLPHSAVRASVVQT